MTGMSWLVAPFSASCPRPESPKIDSAITAPPSSVGTARPSTATAGADALRSAWPNSTRRGESPRTRAPVTKSSSSVATSDVRSWRATLAATVSPSEPPGSAMCCSQPTGSCVNGV